MNTGATAAKQMNPFPGLRPFREDEEYLFFGRESQVDAMVNKLAARRFLAAVGTSGSGKSSLVNCGLLPALHRGLLAEAGTAWRKALLRPGHHPLQALARALSKEGVLFRDYNAAGLTLEEIVDTTLRMSKLGLIDIFEQAQLGEGVNLLVVVDQFEELFRYQQLSGSQQEYAYGVSEEAIAFVNLLLEVREKQNFPIYVVLTMRSDFLGDCAQFPGLPEAINAGQYLVPRMTRNERRSAISGPVGVGGAEIAPVLLTRLVNDVGDNPDQLSILQHALNRTWARWQHQGGSQGPLDLTHYEAIGSMGHALDQHAEKAYAELGSERLQQICAKIFKALTDKTTDPRGVRRPTKLDTLCVLADATEEEVKQVIEVFRKPSRSFLMPPVGEALDKDKVIDISHESLMRIWVRLKTWANDEAQSAQTYRRLAETAELHREGRAGFWRKADLEGALIWEKKENPSAAWATRIGGNFELAMKFLDRSRQESEKEAREKEEQIRKELEHTKQLAAARAKTVRWVSIALLVCFVAAFLSLLLAGFAWLRNEEAAALREYDYVREVAERSKLEAEDNPRLGLLLAAETLRVIEEAKKRAASSIIPPEIRDLDLKLKKLLKLNDAPTKVVEDVLPAGTGSFRQALRAMRNLNQPPLLEKSSGHKKDITSIAVSPDANVIASASLDGELKLWDTQTLSEIDSYKGHREESRDKSLKNGINLVVFSPDGKLIATACKDKTARILDYNRISGSGGFNLIHTIQHEDEVQAVAFSDDGKFLATAGKDGNSILWDAEAKEEYKLEGEGHQDTVYTVAFTGNGQHFATASKDKTVKIWDVETHKLLQTISSRYGEVYNVVYSTESKLLAFGAEKGIEIYELRESEETQYKQVRGPVTSGKSYVLIFDPMGTRLAAAVGKEIKLWDLRQFSSRRSSLRNPEQSFNQSESITTLAFSPLGDRLASADRSGIVKIWTSELIATLKRHRGGVYTTAFSPDGQRLISAGADRHIRVWDATPSGGELPVLFGHTDAVRAITFVNLKGTKLATAGDDGSTRLWETTSESDYLTTENVKGLIDSAGIYQYSPDGRLFATAGRDGSLKIWNTKSGKQIRTIPAHPKDIYALTFNIDGSRLATAGSDQTGTESRYSAKVWDVATGELVQTISGHSQRIAGIAFDSNSNKLATASWDGTAKVWHLETGKLLSTVSIPEKSERNKSSRFNRVVFSPNGTYLATVGLGRIVRIWQINNEIASLATTFNGHTRTIYDMAFSPDGTQLATASADDTARLWESKSGRQISIFRPNAGNVYRVAFSPDGQRLAAACDDGTIRLYLANSVTLRQKGLARLNKPLTLKDCESLRPLELRSCRPFLRIGAAKQLVEEGEAGMAEAFKEFREVLWETGRPEAVIDSEALLEGLDLDKTLANDPEKAAQTWLTKELKLLAKRQANTADIQGLKLSIDSLKVLDPEYSFVKLKERAAEVIENRARTQAQSSNLEEAEKSYQKAVMLNPDLKYDPKDKARKELVKELVSKGRRLLRQKKIEDALANLAEAQKIYPEVEISYRIWSDVCWEGLLQDQATRVMDACERSIKHDPKHEGKLDSDGIAKAIQELQAKAMVSKANSFLRQGDFEAALANLTEAQNVYPEFKIQNYTWANVCREGLRQNQDAKVLTACERYIKNDPKYGDELDGIGVAKAIQEIKEEMKATTLVSKASTLLNQNNFEGAMVSLAEAKKVYPDVKIQNDIWANLCWKGILQDQARTVLDACEQSVRNDPENGGMRDSRGVARAMTGNLEGVIQDLERYVEWAPLNNRPQARADRRKRWIEQLNDGQNPFSPPNREKVIAELKAE